MLLVQFSIPFESWEFWSIRIQILRRMQYLQPASFNMPGNLLRSKGLGTEQRGQIAFLLSRPMENMAKSRYCNRQKMFLEILVFGYHCLTLTLRFFGPSPKRVFGNTLLLWNIWCWDFGARRCRKSCFWISVFVCVRLSVQKNNNAWSYQDVNLKVFLVTSWIFGITFSSPSNKRGLENSSKDFV